MTDAETSSAGAGAAARPFPLFDLQGLLQAKLESIGAYPRRYERGERPRDRIWASELGSCPRAAWHGWRHPAAHDEDFSQHRGALGHAVEGVLADALAPILVAREVSFTNHRASGRADFIVRIDGKQVPVELKSTYGFDLALNAPYPSHALQLRFYVEQMDAPYGLLVYYNLSNYGGKSGHWQALRVPRDDAAVDAAVEALWAAVHAEAEPACRAPGDCFDCSRLEGRT